MPVSLLKKLLLRLSVPLIQARYELRNCAVYSKLFAKDKVFTVVGKIIAIIRMFSPAKQITPKIKFLYLFFLSITQKMNFKTTGNRSKRVI